MRTVERLRKALPPIGGSVNNPVDLSLVSYVSPTMHRDVVRIVAEDEGIDMLLLIAVVGGKLLRDLILEAMRDIKARKPLVVTLMAGPMQSVAQDFPLLLRSGISVYPMLQGQLRLWPCCLSMRGSWHAEAIRTGSRINI